MTSINSSQPTIPRYPDPSRPSTPVAGTTAQRSCPSCEPNQSDDAISTNGPEPPMINVDSSLCLKCSDTFKAEFQMHPTLEEEDPSQPPSFIDVALLDGFISEKFGTPLNPSATTSKAHDHLETASAFKTTTVKSSRRESGQITPELARNSIGGSEGRVSSPLPPGLPLRRFMKGPASPTFSNLNNIQGNNRFLYFSPETGPIYANSFIDVKYIDGREKKHIGDLLKGTKCWWLDVTYPTEEDMKLLSKIFKIHPLTAEDIMTQDTREKCEVFPRYFFVNYRTHESRLESELYMEPVNFYVIVAKDGILSFHFHPFAHAKNVLRRIRHLKDFITVTPDWINYALIDDVTDSLEPLITEMQFEVDTIDDLVLIVQEAEHADMLRRIGNARKRIMFAVRLLAGKAEVVKALIKVSEEMITTSSTGDISLYLSDIQDHVLTMLNNMNHYEKIISRAHTNYLAQISIELTQLSNRTNDVVAKLTVLASVIVPMNLITGLFGMNVKVPGQDEESLRWFFGIVATFSLMSLMGFVYLRKSEII